MCSGNREDYSYGNASDAMRLKADDWGDHNRVDRITCLAWVGCVRNTLSSAEATAGYSNKNSKN